MVKRALQWIKDRIRDRVEAWIQPYLTIPRPPVCHWCGEESDRWCPGCNRHGCTYHMQSPIHDRACDGVKD